MKIIKATFVLLLGLVLLVSCRTEDDAFIDPPIEEAITANSTVANLISRTTQNDGSPDNIIDNASCLSIQLPVTVIVNGIEITIDDEDGYEEIEDILDLFDDDVDSVEISYPVIVILPDFSTVTVNSDEELAALATDCVGENENDDDIECIDFQYPITASVFDENNELIDTITINNDEEMFDFIENLDDFVAVTIEFPIILILADGTTVSVNSIQELITAIENADDSCDEDDDNDFDDDDCESCSTSDLDAIFTECAEWTVDKLERDDEDLEDQFSNYIFSFSSDGMITASENGNVSMGTWEASGTTGNITVDIDIPDLPEFNDSWTLHEIEEETGEVKVDLRIGDDRLRFESDCATDDGGDVDDSVLVNALTTGDWYVNLFFDDVDETADFADYVFNFATDNTATATDDNGTTNGNWSTGFGDETDLELILNFGTGIPLDELQEDWDVIEVTDEIIRLRDISGDGTEDLLTFGRTPFDGGMGGDDLEAILADGIWFVASYTEDNDDQTAIYNGYEIDFESNGTVTASNGSNMNNGTWMVFSGGNQMALNFGTDAPFDEFNDDDWDVISVSPDEVTIQDVSGGNGGIDTLTLQKL